MIYEMIHDEHRDKSYDIDGYAKWDLPGVYCDVCKSHWANAGISYPAVNLTAIPEENSLRSTRRKELNVPFEKYLLYREAVARLLPESALIKPGTRFGPIQGTAHGTFCDVSWCTWYPFVLRNRYEQLIENGINMPMTAPHELHYRGKGSPPDFVALQNPYLAKLSSTCFSPEPPCQKCGYIQVSRQSPIVIEKSSIPDDLDLFRGRELTTYLFVTERFVEIAYKLGITGVIFIPVEVI